MDTEKINDTYLLLGAISIGYINFLEKQNMDLSCFELEQKQEFEYYLDNINNYLEMKAQEEYESQNAAYHDPVMESLKEQEYQHYIEDPQYGEMDFDDWQHVTEYLNKSYDSDESHDEAEKEEGSPTPLFNDDVELLAKELPMFGYLSWFISKHSKEIQKLSEGNENQQKEIEEKTEKQLAIIKLKEDLYKKRKLFLRKQFVKRKNYIISLRWKMLSFLKIPSKNLSNYGYTRENIINDLHRSTIIFLNDCFEYDVRKDEEG